MMRKINQCVVNLKSLDILVIMNIFMSNYSLSMLIGVLILHLGFIMADTIPLINNREHE